MKDRKDKNDLNYLSKFSIAAGGVSETAAHLGPGPVAPANCSSPEGKALKRAVFPRLSPWGS